MTSRLRRARRVLAPDVFAHSDAAPELALCDLRVVIDGHVLIERLPLMANAGQLWCVAGPNGAGKSTRLSVLMGLRSEDGGSVTLDGVAFANWLAPATVRRCTSLLQTLHGSFLITVYQAVMTGRHPHLTYWEWGGDADVRVVDAAVSALHLQPLVQHDVRTLPGGERQRVAMVVVMTQGARVSLLDEPVAYLDLHQQVVVLRLLHEGCRKHDWLVVLTVYDLNLACCYATHVLLMDGEGQTAASIVADVLTPEHCARVLHTPIAEVADGRRTVLTPDDPDDDRRQQ